MITTISSTLIDSINAELGVIIDAARKSRDVQAAFGWDGFRAAFNRVNTDAMLFVINNRELWPSFVGTRDQSMASIREAMQH